MRKMNCEEFKQLLEKYHSRFDNMPLDQQYEAFRHMAECRDCQTAFIREWERDTDCAIRLEQVYYSQELWERCERKVYHQEMKRLMQIFEIELPIIRGEKNASSVECLIKLDEFIAKGGIPFNTSYSCYVS